MKNSKSIIFYYAIMTLVVVLWGISPIVTDYIYNFYSSTFCTFLFYSVSAFTLLFIYIKQLKYLNKELLKTAIFTGIFLAIGNVLYRMGLKFTTPSKYAFLENLQMVFVPIVIFFVARKKPSLITVISCVVCVFGCASLCEVFTSLTINKGDLLCCIATLFFAINIGVTGSKISKFNPVLFVIVQMFVNAVISLISALALNFIKVGGQAIEPIVFVPDLKLLILLIGDALISGAICWVLRTKALKYIDTTAYTIMLSFSAIVATTISLIIGTDTLSASLVIGAILIFSAIVTSGVCDIIKQNKGEQNVKD